MTPDPIMAFKSRRLTKKSSSSSSSSSSSNRYLKPGALAQLRYNLSASRCCTDIGKKRVVLDSKDKKCIEKKRIMMNSQERKVVVFPPNFDNNFKSPTDPHHAVSQFKSYEPSSTASTMEFECHSRLESLPIELLVKILCFLHHDQLRAVFHVSQRIRSAVIVARQTYFNYTTPDRSRLEILCMQTPLPADRWPFARRGWEEGRRTPWAPRQGPRAQARLQGLDVRPISAVLFQEDSSDPRALLPSNRVLFYEDDLCHAVTQNKLR